MVRIVADSCHPDCPSTVYLGGDKRIMHTRYCWLMALITASVLIGCQTQTPSEPARETPAGVEAEPAADPRATRAQTLEAWLDQADRALSEDRLLTPPEDNAHDRYRAVLYLDPDNRRAESGLQAIVLRYLDLARSAARQGAFAQAREMLERASTVDPDNSLVAELAREVAEAEERRKLKAPMVRSEDSYLLDPGRLARRDASLVEKLHELAQTVKDTGAFVLIVSRTDAEGRWIYQQMRDALPNYLLRGNIKRGSPPQIKLLPAIESEQ